MLFLDGNNINELFSYREFIPYLKKAFTQAIIVPQRQHFTLEKKNRPDTTLLIMPAWQLDHRIGIKIVNVFPDNDQYSLPSIQGTYLLFSAETGSILCSLDGKELTAKRTAAASALASSYLSRENSKTLLMLGTGTLCNELIKAHTTIRNISRVWIWGRNFEKAKKKAASIKINTIEIQAIENNEDVIASADIISCATLSKTPLFDGALVSKGSHIDLVGSFTPDAREADDRLIKKSRVFIDTESACIESGDIVIPLQKGILTKQEIGGDLTSICKTAELQRKHDNEITLFKSVGYALEDLAAASYLFDKFSNMI